jgi:hypothetical protein
VQFTNSGMTAHMSVFPSRTYKKGHRHGPGVVIIIPAGEGYSIMWEEGREKVFIPWHEASVFVPPNRWFHQHFNVGSEPARYLAFHTPRVEGELGKRSLTSLMPNAAYNDPTYKWAYAEED